MTISTIMSHPKMIMFIRYLSLGVVDADEAKRSTLIKRSKNNSVLEE